MSEKPSRGAVFVPMSVEEQIVRDDSVAAWALEVNLRGNQDDLYDDGSEQMEFDLGIAITEEGNDEV